MSRRRKCSAPLAFDALPPTQGLPTFRAGVLAVMAMCTLGMVFLFGGTADWAASPFLLPALPLLSAFWGVGAWRASRGCGSVAFPPELMGGLLLWGYVLLRAGLGTGVPHETWSEAYWIGLGWLWFACFSDLGTDLRLRQAVCWLMLLATVLQAMLALSLQWHEDPSVLWLPRPEHYGMRASGTFICPNHFGHFLQMGILLACCLLWTPQTRPSLRLFCGYTLLTAVPALLLTLSRAAWLGTLVGVFTLCLCKALRGGRGKAVRILLGLGLGTAGAVALLWWNYAPFRRRFQVDFRDNIRLGQIWPDTWDMIRAESVWGVGPGVYKYAFEPHREAFSGWNLYLEYAHNEYLHLLAEYGWVPALLLFMGAGMLCLRWFRAARKTSSDRRAMVPITLLTLSLGALAHAVFDFNLHIPANVLTGLMLLGVWSGSGETEHLWRSPRLPKFLAPWALAAPALIALLLLIPSLRLGMGSYHEYQLLAARNRHDKTASARHAAELRCWTPGDEPGWIEAGQQLRAEAVWMRDPVVKAELIREAERFYQSARERNRYSLEALAGLADLALMEGNVPAALEALREWVRLAPFDVNARIQLGLALRQAELPAEALKVFLEARELRGARKRQIELNINSLQRLLEAESAQKPADPPGDFP